MFYMRKINDGWELVLKDLSILKRSSLRSLGRMLLLSALLSVSGALSCAAVPDHVKYFGYLGVYQIDWKNHVTYDHVLESFENTKENMVDLRIESIEDPKIVKAIKQYNIHVLLDVKNLLLTTSGRFPEACCGAGNLKLRPPSIADQQWQRLKKAISGLEDHIYGFYLDEPFWAGLTQENLDVVMNDYLKRDYPNIRRVILESGDMVDKNGANVLTREYLKDFTDVGAGSYGLDCSGQDYRNRMNRLMGLAPNARLWVLPGSLRAKGLPSKEKLMDAFDNCVNYSYNNDKVIGIMVWGYNASPKQKELGAVGLREFSNPSSPWYDAAYTLRHLQVGGAITRR